MEYYYYSLVLVSIGVFFDSLHSLYNYERYYSNYGFFRIEVLTLDGKSSISKIINYIKPFINNSNFKIVLIVRLLISASIIFFPSFFFPLINLLFLIQLLFNIRNTFSLSGADQMRSILLFGLSIMSFKNNFFLLGGIFIIFQLYISYFFTGYNKLKSPIWRKGSALIYVMNSELFGNRVIQSFLIKKGQTFNIIICWVVILFQLLFPVMASIPQTIIFVFIIGFLFHFSLAVISNLNDFFWTFLSAYPVVYYFVNYFWDKILL